jgi:hypothetical protein
MKQTFLALLLSGVFSFSGFSSPVVDLTLRSTITLDEKDAAILASHPDRVLKTHIANGKFSSIDWGDYLHLNFKVGQKGDLSLFATDDRLTYFVLAHRSKTIRIQYQSVESWIPEAGGYQPIDRIVSAQLGSTDFQHWWLQQCVKTPEPKLRAEYEKQLSRLLQEYEK